MPIIHFPGCSTPSFFKPCASFTNYRNNFITITPFAKHPKSRLKSFKRLYFFSRIEKVRRAHVRFCAENGVLEEVGDTILPRERESEGSEELELLSKPSPKVVDNGPLEEVEKNEQKKPDSDEVLEPFYKFFKPFEEKIEPGDFGNESSIEDSRKVSVEYYEPKRGDLVVGVVVSGNENKLDVSVGADLLGTMLTKEVLPLYDKEMDHLLWDSERDAELLVRGKLGIVKNDEALNGELMPGKPVVEPGTVLFAEVLGRTLGGRPLLSTRRLFRRVAWHRVRQIKQLNEPLEIKITEWNTGGLLTRIEGLRAFIPKAELINRVNNYTELKENVGRRIYVQITRINEETNDLILSEKEAWAMMHLQEGTLLEGTVKKIFPYGAQIRIGDTNRSGLLHISNITRGRVNSVSDLLVVDDQVKVLVIKSMFPDKISLSIVDLESEPGLFLSNKEKVFSEAKVMAKKYKQKLSAFSATRKLEALPTDSIPFEDEERLCANWKWFEFKKGDDKDL